MGESSNQEKIIGRINKRERGSGTAAMIVRDS